MTSRLLAYATRWHLEQQQKKDSERKIHFQEKTIFALVMLNLKCCVTVKWRCSRNHLTDKPRAQTRDQNWTQRLTNCQFIVTNAK